MTPRYYNQLEGIEIVNITKNWAGIIPLACETCDNALADFFNDGKTKDGPWAIMCDDCLPIYGVGLGVGRGRKFNALGEGVTVSDKPDERIHLKAEDREAITEKVGEGFWEVLELAMKIRINRREQYGDTYQDDELTFLYYQIRNKLKRFRSQLQIDGLTEKIKDEEVAIDSLVDLICYSAFAIENIKGKK